MKYFYLLLFLTLSTLTFAQENTKDLKVVELNDDSIEVPFSIIERVPVYEGCNERFNNSELKKCMSDKINKHISKRFNTDITKNLNLPEGPVRISVIFKIDKAGKVVGVKSRTQHPKLEEEAIRVIKLIPQLTKPGYQKGKPVIVPYALPIVFHVINANSSNYNETPVLTKKQKRKLERLLKKQNKN